MNSRCSSAGCGRLTSAVLQDRDRNRSQNPMPITTQDTMTTSLVGPDLPGPSLVRHPLAREPNSNYSASHPYSCQALTHAIVGCIPPAFGQPGLPA